MHAAILTLGSRGDIQPYVALALGLVRAGHSVTLGTHELFQDWIEGLGLGFSPVHGNPRELLESAGGKAWLEGGGNPLAFMQKLIALGRPMLAQMQQDCWDACQGADLIVFGGLAMIGATIGEKLGVPAIPAFLQPVARTLAFPCAMIDAPHMPGFANLMTYHAFEQAIWQASRSLVNAHRAQLGLPPYGFFGPFGELYRQDAPFLLGISPLVVARPADWPASIELAGYWFLDRPEAWRPPADLAAFLEAGPPPVYVGFGSMTPRDPAGLAERIIAALRRAGVRGILLAGWGGLEYRDATDDVFVVESVPHDWLFPRMAGIVHHGGAGTTGAALRSGVPSLITPFFADQPFWGRRVAELGVGPAPIPYRRLSADTLAAGLRRLLDDPAMRDRAAALGAAIRTEDGIGRAVARIEQAAARRV